MASDPVADKRQIRVGGLYIVAAVILLGTCAATNHATTVQEAQELCKAAPSLECLDEPGLELGPRWSVAARQTRCHPSG